MLQDIILTMKNKFEILTNSNLEEVFLSKLTNLADKDIEFFKSERPNQCSVVEQCTSWYENSVFKILRVFMNQGPKSALELLRKKIDHSRNVTKDVDCPDKKCLTNIENTFGTLKKLIIESKEISEKDIKVLININQEPNLEDGCEESVSKLLAPLSNATRIKILKHLGKGGMHYTQLERQIGIKGGHLQHHLTSLKNAGYMEKLEGKYSITHDGLKILNFLTILKEEMLPVS